MQTSVVIALYTISVSHFNMDARLFCGIMASHGFQPREFQPRAANTKLPPPFDSGPPLGEGLANPDAAADNFNGTQQGGGAAAQNHHGLPGGAMQGGNKRAARAHVRRLEQAGESLIQERNIAHTMARTYPFLLQNADDLFLKDVRELLEQYRSVVLKYEGLKAALQATH